ncbi:MAG: FAD-dependent oxidoreductase [Chloroflexota bacterium]
MIKTTVCIVGAGPAGVILSYLLAKNGIDCVLVEAQKDFDRDFRGDTLHYSVMENIHQMGLANNLLATVPHYTMRKMFLDTPKGRLPLVDFERINTPFPYVTVMPQQDFLSFVTTESTAYDNFHLMMRTVAQELVRDENGRICGVQVRQNNELKQINADLVVACDGRSSKLRRLAGLQVDLLTDPLDVLWFRLPKFDNDPELQIGGGFSGGSTPVVVIERHDHYQMGIVVANGQYRQLKSKGLEELHHRIVQSIPQFEDRVNHVDSWRKVSYLKVTGSRLKQWHKDGMLLIGDAAHVMTPLGGVGINYAIQDAIVAANVLLEPLKSGQLQSGHFEEIQNQRQRPTRWMQFFQTQAQKRILDPARTDDTPFEFPRFMRWLPRIPLLRDLLPRMIGSGLSRVEVKVA